MGKIRAHFSQRFTRCLIYYSFYNVWEIKYMYTPLSYQRRWRDPKLLSWKILDDKLNLGWQIKTLPYPVTAEVQFHEK